MTVTLRDAATVMLVRDATDGQRSPSVEVCMLRRNLDSEFVAGVYVFPGGSVDPGDRVRAAEDLCPGLTDAAASTTLGVPVGGLALWVAALRECFEEAGVLLARWRDGSDPSALLDTSEPAVQSRFEAHRHAVNAGSVGLLDVCRQEGLVLAVDSVHYVSHWITPELAPRRYDTRFFVTAAPPGQVARHDDGETIASIWIRPDDALARFEAGDIELLPPTVANLGQLAAHSSTDEVLAWAREVRDIPTVLPIVLFEDGRLLVLRPGDPGYEQALEDRMASSDPLSPELLAAAKTVWGPRAGLS